MIEYNKLSYNWKSTADFPFKIYVESNDGINLPHRKNKLITTDEMHGANLKQSDKYGTVEKRYKLYVWNVSLPELTQVFDWLNNHYDDSTDYAYTKSLNVLQPYDTPNYYYHVLKVDIGKAQLDEIGGYEFEVTFTCSPFAYKLNREGDSEFYFDNRQGGTINNDTSVPWFPQLTIAMKGTNEGMLTIGNQHVTLRSPNNNLLRMNCIPGAQNLSDDTGLLNECMIGEFFVIPPGEHGVVLDSNIESVSVFGGKVVLL